MRCLTPFTKTPTSFPPLLPVSRTLVLLLSTALLAAAGCAPGGTSTTTSTAAADWQTLFDGKSLAGWHNPYDWGEARVRDSVIELRANKKFFLVTDTTYRDFVFEGEVKLPDTSSNSGFMFRAHARPNRVWGYQAEVDPSARQWAGGLYDEGRRGWLHPAGRHNEAAGERFRSSYGEAFKPTQWNHYRIRAEGDSLKIWVNGAQTTAYRDTTDSEGVIGIQHHGEDGKVYRFRNLRIRRLGAAGRTETSAGKGEAPNTLTKAEREAGWQMLFDGKSFKGWTGLDTGQIPVGHWKIDSGAIKKVESGEVPTAPDGQPLEGGDIMTKQTYRNFELKWQWKVAKGANSGVKYNVSESLSTAHEPKRAALGFEYQVLDDKRHPDSKDPTHRASALYDLIAPNTAQKHLNPPGQWNQARLVFNGSHGEHWLNEKKVLEYDLDSAHFDSIFAKSKYVGYENFAQKRDGHIVLQDHSDEAWYRDLKIRKLSPGA